jgi:hypothetical protein
MVTNVMCVPPGRHRGGRTAVSQAAHDDLTDEFWSREQST